MPPHGRKKDIALAAEPSSREESGWQGVRTELRSWMHKISHAFGKGGFSGSFGGDPWLRQLRKLHSPTFKGKGAFEECQAWLRQIKKLLDSMACPVEHWVRLAAFQLKGDADDWWTDTRRLKFLDSITVDIKWKDNEAAFYEKYFPSHVQNRLDREFRNLQQGSMTVAE